MTHLYNNYNNPVLGRVDWVWKNKWIHRSLFFWCRLCA